MQYASTTPEAFMPDTLVAAPIFAIRDLYVASYAGGFTLWNYQHRNGLLDDVMPPGFFNDAGDMFEVGDMILVTAKDGGRILVVIQTGERVVVGPLS